MKRIVNCAVAVLLVGIIFQVCTVPLQANQDQETNTTKTNDLVITPENFLSFEMKTVVEKEKKILRMDADGKTSLEIQKGINTKPLKLELPTQPIYLSFLLRILNYHKFLKLADELAKLPAEKEVTKTFTLTMRELKKPFFVSDNRRTMPVDYPHISNIMEKYILGQFYAGKAVATEWPLVTRENFRWMKISTHDHMSHAPRSTETLITDGYALSSNRGREEQIAYAISDDDMTHHIERLNEKRQGQPSNENLDRMSVDVMVGLRDAQGIYPPFHLPELHALAFLYSQNRVFFSIPD